MADFSVTTFLTSLVGSGATAFLVVKALSGHLADRWLTKYKSDLDKEFESYRDSLEQRRKHIEAELGHRSYVTKTQFDTEFNSVKDIFAALGKLRLSFNGLRPFVDWTPTDQQEKLELITARLNHFRERFNVLVDAAESVYPFVPEDIYEQLEMCMKAAMIEIRHIEQSGADALSPKGYADGEKQHSTFSTAYFKAAKLVREHFKQLSEI
ncbi:MAG: hypothetical protein WBQ10_20700 [Terriglobales bacterium]